MTIYQHHGASVPQKVFLTMFQTVALAVAAWLLIGNGLPTLSERAGWNLETGNEARRYLLLACLVVFYARIQFTSLYLLKRAIGWEEALSMPIGFLMYYIGFSLLGGTRQIALDWVDGLAIALFCAGSFTNTYAEILRDRWRKQPQNQGRLYTDGLFRYSRHVNYFGDLVWVSALALLTRNAWSVPISVVLFMFFHYFNAPMLDRHLQDKYPQEFAEYTKRTKSLIPFIL
jgi:protein-S-isoprenylcysteine O-methyltransferase Ste14